LRVGEGIADGAGLSHRATDLRLKGRASTPPLPMRVLLELLGLPVADADFIKQWCHDHMLLSVPGIGAAQQLRSAQTRGAVRTSGSAHCARNPRATSAGSPPGAYADGHLPAELA
jgi:hypothetical protein